MYPTMIFDGYVILTVIMFNCKRTALTGVGGHGWQISLITFVRFQTQSNEPAIIFFFNFDILHLFMVLIIISNYNTLCALNKFLPYSVFGCRILPFNMKLITCHLQSRNFFVIK
jgi:hypothetical protein